MKENKVFFWDFDGVLLNSNAVRDRGFIEVLKDYPESEVQQLLEFHQRNGGLSRYVKFRYFFEEVRGESISEEQVKEWAQRFSFIMKKLLVNPELLIEESVAFVEKHHANFPMHIVSGSDGNELRYLCDRLNIARYFVSIHGSPTPKKQLVRDVLNSYQYPKSDCLLIGDSINDYEAAEYNGISFYGYNNPTLKSKNYINAFNDFKF
jgi:phosphoglycolate phosphatase-like HAD superfamily hydrolase